MCASFRVYFAFGNAADMYPRNIPSFTFSVSWIAWTIFARAVAEGSTITAIVTRTLPESFIIVCQQSKGCAPELDGLITYSCTCLSALKWYEEMLPQPTYARRRRRPLASGFRFLKTIHTRSSYELLVLQCVYICCVLQLYHQRYRS